jgi:membrane protease subunit (stomatin/prohibitin family)
MGILDMLRDEFLDVIEFEDTGNRQIVAKFRRSSEDNELKQGSRVIVRESQCAVFLKGGQLADIMPPGTYTLNTENFPILTKLAAFPFLFVSPVISDVYFVSTRQFIDNKWATKNLIVKKDKEFGVTRLRAFGKFAFRIVDVERFMTEIFGTRGIVMSEDIVDYLSSMVTEVFSETVGGQESSILDLASEYRKISAVMQKKLSAQQALIGIAFSDIILESVSLPEEVEKLIDEQSGIGLARGNMESFMQYQTARAMRDAAKQEGGLAGLGTGFALGGVMAKNLKGSLEDEQQASEARTDSRSKAELLRELKELLDEEILTREEFDAEKKRILGN